MGMAERSQYETEYEQPWVKRTVIGMIILALITLLWGVRHIQNDLVQRSAAGLTEKRVDTASLALSFSGRTARVQVVEGREAFADRAAAHISSLYGVRNATIEVLPAEEFNQAQSLAALAAANSDSIEVVTSTAQLAVTGSGVEASESDSGSKWWRFGNWFNSDEDEPHARDTEPAVKQASDPKARTSKSLVSRLFDSSEQNSNDQDDDAELTATTQAGRNQSTVSQIEVNHLFVEGTTLFTSNSYEAIQTMVDELRNKTGPIEVVATETSLDNPMFSAITAQFRANMVLFALMQHGINPLRLSARGVVVGAKSSKENN